MQLTIDLWIAALLPILVLLATIVGLKWGAPKAGAAAWFVALAIGATLFGADVVLLATASAKGLSLSLFVLTIIWSSVFLYNVIERLGGPGVIGHTMAGLVGDKLLQSLLIGWCFAGFLQGITGFGLPVAVATPLLVIVGIDPARAALMALVGHSWAVTFGSMGSSYYTIQLVTGLPRELIGPWMAFMFAMPIVTTGLGVAYVHDGARGVRQGLLPVILAGTTMSLAMWFLNMIGAPQISSAIPALLGSLVIWAIARWAPVGERRLPIMGGARQGEASAQSMSFHLAFLPYYALVVLTVLSQVPLIRDGLAGLAWGLDYPALHTGLGYTAEAVRSYAKISLFNHPAPLVMGAALVSYVVYRLRGHWRSGVGWEAARLTYKQCVPTSVGIATTVMMALIMNDTGMTTLLAHRIAQATGSVFPLVSPFVGVLGCFTTGSNTTSNVMFGALQMETAKGLGISTVLVAAAQSIGGSLGSIIAPAKVMVGTAVVGLGGRESDVMRRAIPYCLLLVLLVGVECWLFVYVLFANVP